MFITKKHLSRRTFLRGAGVAVGLPLLDAMVPSLTALAQTAAAPKPRLGFLYLPHGAIMEHWTPATEGAELRADADPQAAGAVPEAADDRQRPREQAGDRAAGARAQSRAPGSAASRRAPTPGAVRRRHRRPDRRGAHRPGHAAPVAGGRHRRPRRQRRLRPELRLQLRRHDLVPHADHAAADGGRPAQAVRAAVRPGRHAAGAQGDLEAVLEHPRPGDAARPPTCRRRSTRADRAQRGRLPRERARDRAPRAEDGGAGSVQPRSARRAGRHRRSTSA